MQSYGYMELPLNMEKAKEVASKEYENMMLTLEEEELLDVEVYQCIEHGEECTKKVTDSVDAFIEKVNSELGISIYVQYVGSEAEGTDRAGELMWCVCPELPDRVAKNTLPWETWSEFG